MAARKKATEATPTAPPAAAPYNPTPGYQPPPGYDGPGPPGGSSGGQDAAITAPPERRTAPFINAMFLWELKRPVSAVIENVRTASGGRPEFGNKKGWFLDVKLETGQDATARISEGDQRHARLWAKYGPAWKGQRVTLRLSHPGDETKAAWTLDAL